MPRTSIAEQLPREWQDVLGSLPPERTNTPGWMRERARPVSSTALFAELEDVCDIWRALRVSTRLEEYADRFVNSAWTLQQLLAHLASWAREFRQEVETAASGETFDYAIPFALSVVGPNQWNQVEVEKRAAQSLDALLEEFEQETRRLQDLVLELPEDSLVAESQFPLAPSGDPAALWRGSIGQIVLMKCVHDRYHIEHIRRWLAAEAARSEPATQASVEPIRKGFHTITPYLVVESAAQLMDFLQQVFNAEEVLRVERPDGKLMHAEARIGDSMIEMADATPQHPPMPTVVHLYVEGADAVYQRALQAGAASLYAPRDQEYGDREAGVKDPFGNVWYIGTHRGRSHIPEGLRSLTPTLHPRGATKLIDFLKQAFEAEEIDRTESPEGTIVYARVSIGDSVLEIGEAHGEFQPIPSMIHLYVSDADAVYRHAIGAGATSLFEPRNEPYGDRVAAVRDPFGHTWCIATHIKDVSP